MTPEDLQGWAVMPGGWQGWGYAGLMWTLLALLTVQIIFLFCISFRLS
jgi:hypothetical protein